MTLKETLARSVLKHGQQTVMTYKRDGEWRNLTYAEFQDLVRNVAEILATSCRVRPNDRVALMAGNSPEWCAIHYAITGIGATAVPIDAKLQAPEVCHILSDSGAVAIFMDAHGEENILDFSRRIPALKTVVLFGKKLDLDPFEASRKGIRLLDLDEQLAATREASQSPRAAYDRMQPTDDTIASFIYTSGTTGRQKGAMLSHGNFVADFESLAAALDIYTNDNFFLLLPLHHAFAFTTCLVTPIAAGCRLSFAEGLRTIGENIRETRPTVVLGVPLLLEKMFDKMKAGIKANASANFLWNVGLRGPVRKGLKEKLGGRIRLMVSGGAPVDPQLIADMESYGLRAREGYGLTECAPVLSLTPYEGPIVPGSCGRVLPFIEMKVFDPNAEGVGELAARGGNIMKGYFNNPAATEEVFRDGWFLTGDLGYIDADNYVHITGRKKALIVNREGKNIYPEEVELQINASPLIRECVVLGYRDAEEAVGEHVGVIVVPDEDALAAREASEKRKFTEAEIIALLRKEVKTQCSNLADYKHPRRIQIRWEEFNKTSTGKIKRYLYNMATEDA